MSTAGLVWYPHSKFNPKKSNLTKYGHLSKQHIDLAVLRQAVDDPDKMLATWRLSSSVLSDYSDVVDSALAPPPALPPPMFDDTDQTT